MADTFKIHARVTKEVTISRKQAEKLLAGDPEVKDLVASSFLLGATSGNYEAGYIPHAWLMEDLKELLDENKVYIGNDIDL